MIEWLILLVLVPAVLVPVVLLWGFAGCGSFAAGAPPVVIDAPDAPHGLKASAVSRAEIKLEWKHSSNGAGTHFLVERERNAPSTGFDPGHAGPLIGLEFVDQNLAEFKSYRYRVRAKWPGADLSSDPSEVAGAQTFGTTFEAPLTDETNRPNQCLVLRIEPAQLSRSGTRVRITLQRPTSENLLISSITVSRAASAGNPYDSADDPTPVLATYPMVVPKDPANGEFPLPEVAFAVDANQPLLIAFDIANPGRVRRSDNQSGVEAFFNGPAGEAMQKTRSAGYDSRPRAHLVQRIEVTT